MAPLHSTSGMMALLRKAARLLALAALALLVAVGVRPAPAMACGDARVAVHVSGPVSSHAHAAPDLPSAHGSHQHGDVPHVGAQAADGVRAADAGHGSAGHGHAAPCCYSGCPACLAQVPAAPLAVHMMADHSAIVLGATPLPAGIVLAPPRAPPKAA